MGILITFSIIAFITFFYVKSVDKMMTEHPDYNGKDLFDEE
jgi:large-conductance mechanosensitive channel